MAVTIFVEFSDESLKLGHFILDSLGFAFGSYHLEVDRVEGIFKAHQTLGSFSYVFLEQVDLGQKIRVQGLGL